MLPPSACIRPINGRGAPSRSPDNYESGHPAARWQAYGRAHALGVLRNYSRRIKFIALSILRQRSAPSNIHDAVHPAPTPRARQRPPSVDDGIPSRPWPISPADPGLQDPGWYAIYRDCNVRSRSIQILDRHCSRCLSVVEVECSTEPRIAINCAVICSHDRRRVATASSATSRQLVHA